MEKVPCVHQPFQGDNVAEHEAAGYCGNTATTVSREERMWDEPWEASFLGEDSVALTDLTEEQVERIREILERQGETP